MRLYILATDPLDHSRKIYSVSDFGFIQQQKIASEDGIGFRRQTFWITIWTDLQPLELGKYENST